jgi:predicted TPR repeat methyltransferase
VPLRLRQEVQAMPRAEPIERFAQHASWLVHLSSDALRDGRVFDFSLGASEGKDFVPGATRRFAHSNPCLRRPAQDTGFAVATIESGVLRQQGGIDVAGYLAVLRAPRSDDPDPMLRP